MSIGFHVIVAVALTLFSVTDAFAEEEKPYENLQMKNAQVIELSPDEAATINQQTLENSVKRIDQSDGETQSALRRAAEDLHVTLPKE